MEAGVEKIPITPMLMENKVYSIRKAKSIGTKIPSSVVLFARPSTDRWEKIIDLMHKIIFINMKT